MKYIATLARHTKSTTAKTSSDRIGSAYDSCLHILLCLTLFFPMLAGCRTYITQDYGESETPTAKSSPGGMTVFRNLAERKMKDSYTIRSLSPANMERLNTIVWCPDQYAVHSESTHQWLNTWLKKGNRTLIYIGRDFSPHELYWSQIAKGLLQSQDTSSDALEALTQAAIEREQLDSMRRRNRPYGLLPWTAFDYSPSEFTKVEQFRGEWANLVENKRTEIYLRARIKPFRTDMTEWRDLVEWEPKNPTPTTTAPKIVIPVSGPEDYSKQWRSEDITLRAIFRELDVTRLPTYRNLLATEDQEPIVTRFESAQWASSRVYVVANNSLFSNIGMLQPGHRDLAEAILHESSYGGIGFLAGKYDPQIRSDNGGERQKGFEMLTIWPLNVVTIHAAFLGLAIMVAAFPIFGRPKRVPTRSTADFGQHIDAVGDMMNRTHDRFYALQTISDYFRNVRKDTVSPWAKVGGAEQEQNSPFLQPQSTDSPGKPLGE